MTNLFCGKKTVRSGSTRSLLWKLCLCALCLFTSLLAGVAGPPSSALQTAPRSAPWALSWSDEFDGPSGAPPDPRKWVAETGGGGWGNQELEYYTSRRENIRQENGQLIIEARREQFTGPDGVTRDFTSARLKTEGVFGQKYGRFEARMRLPHGQGLWPAFWLLGDDFPSAGWPKCGEIDIMENKGSQPSTVSGALHGPGYFGDRALVDYYSLPRGQFGDDFHVFSIEWDAKGIRYYVDDHLFQTKTRADLPPSGRWVFDHRFFMVLNLAVGGGWPGNPDDSTKFPQRLVVDYVRVYSRR